MSVARKPTQRRRLDKHDLYELCVTDGPRLARFLLAVHGGSPRLLREDFSGTGALARGWSGLGARMRAIAVDSDRAVLRRAEARGVRTVAKSVMDCDAKADTIAATNFPIGYWHVREELLAYLRHARRCLNLRGVFVCDTYGGRDAFSLLRAKKRVRVSSSLSSAMPLSASPAPPRDIFPEASRGGAEAAEQTGKPKRLTIDYTWQQREADPLTARVVDALSFRVLGEGKPRVLKDAFVYDWRLWSIPELRDAMMEAGFARVEVYDRLGDAVDGEGNLYVRAVEEGDLEENFVVYVVGRR